MTLGFAINPGSDPVEGSTAENALANLEALCRDIRAQDSNHTARVESPDLEDGTGGRFRGYIVVSGERITIDMPGLPLEKVRYIHRTGQDIYEFPRIYVEGSSWIWDIGVNVCIGMANGDYRDDEEEA